MASGNTVKNGTGTYYDLLVDDEGRQIIVGPAAHDAAAAGSPLRIGGVYHSSNPAGADGDILDLLLDALGRLRVNDDWTPGLQAEESANDSDKEFAVPASTEWRVKWIWVELTSTGDAGNRQMAIEIQDDSDDVIAQVRAGAVQAASQVRYYLFAPYASDLTAFRDTDFIMNPIPEFILPAGYDVRVFDKAAIQAAADDMVVQMMVEARSV